VLDPGGALHDEPARLLLDELPPALGLRPILDAIGGGAHKLTEIAARIGTPATSLARPLARLAEMGMVIRETPFGEPERSTKRALYRLADPFLRLWFAVVAPKRALLAHAPQKTRLTLFDARAPHLDAASWEELCRAAVPRLGKVLGVDFGVAKRYWGGSGPEWDVAAQSVEGRTFLLGEVKWTTTPATEEVLARAYAALLHKGRPPFAGDSVRHALFVPILPRRRSRSLPGDVRIIDARMVLAALADAPAEA
jgi:hypothetical protein